MLARILLTGLLTFTLDAAWLPLWAQTVGEEVEILVSGVSYLRSRISEGAAASNAVIALDPAVLEDVLKVGAADSSRATRVAERLDLRVASFRELLNCSSCAPCVLNAEVVFRFGRPAISGDTATIMVAFRYKGRPEWREQAPLQVVELILARSPQGWTVLRSRTLLISAVPMWRYGDWAQIAEERPYGREHLSLA